MSIRLSPSLGSWVTERLQSLHLFPEAVAGTATFALTGGTSAVLAKEDRLIFRLECLPPGVAAPPALTVWFTLRGRAATPVAYARPWTGKRVVATPDILGGRVVSYSVPEQHELADQCEVLARALAQEGILRADHEGWTRS